MTLQAYHGGKLSEALKLLQNKPLKKYLYRATTRDESIGYAHIAKRDDKYTKGSLTQAHLSIPDNQVYTIDPLSNDILYDKKSVIYKTHIGRLSLGTFDVFLIPPKFQSIIKNPRIVEVV